MRDLVWPLGIAGVLLLFVAVNAAFAWVAVSHAPEVDPSYTQARER